MLSKLNCLFAIIILQGKKYYEYLFGSLRYVFISNTGYK